MPLLCAPILLTQEVGCELGTEVGYAVRFEDCTCPDTKIKYLTGIWAGHAPHIFVSVCVFTLC